MDGKSTVKNDNYIKLSGAPKDNLTGEAGSPKAMMDVKGNTSAKGGMQGMKKGMK